MTDNKVRVRLTYRAGDMMPGEYIVTPSQAEAIMQAGWAIGELLYAFGLGEPITPAMTYDIAILHPEIFPTLPTEDNA